MGIWNGIDAVSNLVGSQKVIRMFIKFSSLFLDIDTGNRKIGIQTITSTETSTASPGTRDKCSHTCEYKQNNNCLWINKMWDT